MLGFTANFDATAERNRLEDEKRARQQENRRKREKRIAYQKNLSGSHSAGRKEGVIGKVRQMNSYNPEAVAAESLVDLMLLGIAIFEALFNIPYVRKIMANNSLLCQELAAQLQGEDLCLVYQPDRHGNYPELFPKNAKGEVDDAAPAITDPLEITEDLIRANGYAIAPPTDVKGMVMEYLMGFQTAIDQHIENILGSNAISQEARSRIHGPYSQAGGSSNEEVDPNAVNMMMRRPIPAR